MMRLGGPILGTTNKGDPFASPMPDGSLRDRSKEVIAAYHALRLDALIGIGGGGSLSLPPPPAPEGGGPPPRGPPTPDKQEPGVPHPPPPPHPRPPPAPAHS